MRLLVAVLFSLSSLLCGTVVQDGAGTPAVAIPQADLMASNPSNVLTSVQIVAPAADAAAAADAAPAVTASSDVVFVRSWGPLRSRRLRGGSTGSALAYGSTGAAVTTTVTTTTTTEAVTANGSTGAGVVRTFIGGRTPVRNMLGRTMDTVRRTGNCR